MQITVDANQIILALNNLGVELIKELQRDLEVKKVNASGKFSKSLNSRVEQSGTKFILSIYGEGYAKFIQNGRRPGGVPPIAEIRKWIFNKRIPYTKGMEYAIAKSIAKKGTATYQGRSYYIDPITGTLNSQSVMIDRVNKIFGQFPSIKIAA